MDALVIMGMQNDFLPGGSLAVERGAELIGPINEFINSHEYVLAVRDWHPDNHISFEGAVTELDQGGYDPIKRWPRHCVADTYGSFMTGEIKLDAVDMIFNKAMSPDEECFSAFGAVSQGGNQPFLDFLQSIKVDKIVLVGMMLEYGIFATACDALLHNISVDVIARGCAAFEAQKIERIYSEMRVRGVSVIE